MAHEYGYINKQYTVWCAYCGEWEQLNCGSSAVFKKLIRAIGWRETRKNGWVCPKCNREKES